MNAQSPMAAAIIRGLYLAVGMFAVTFLTVWGTTDDLKASLIAGGITGLGALGFRAGGEGVYDQRRSVTGNVKRSDVGQS